MVVKNILALKFLAKNLLQSKMKTIINVVLPIQRAEEAQ